MPLHTSIQQSINQYNRRLGAFFRTKNPAIARIEALPDAEKSDLYTVYECFLPNPPTKESSPNTHKVYLSVLAELFPLERERHFDFEDTLAMLSNGARSITRENYTSLKTIFDTLPNPAAEKFYTDFFYLVRQMMRRGVRPCNQAAIDMLCQYAATVNFKKLGEMLFMMDLPNTLMFLGTNKKDWLTMDEFSAILSNPNANHIINLLWATCKLTPFSNLIPSISELQFAQIMQHPHPELLAGIAEDIVNNIIRLNRKFNACKSDALDILIMSSHPQEILPWLRHIERQENSLFSRLYEQISSSDINAVAKVLDWLWVHGDDRTKQIFEDVSHSGNRGKMLAKILRICANNNALSQENVASLFNLYEGLNYLFSDEANAEIWGRIPEHQLSAEVIGELLQHAGGINPRESLQDYVNQLLGITHLQIDLANILARRQIYLDHLQIDWANILARRPLEFEQYLRANLNQFLHMPQGAQLPAAAVAPVVFNDLQSTHTASVHRTISESATKLNQHYGAAITGTTTRLFSSRLDAKLNEIQSWVHSLPADVPKYDAAKRCINRLINPSNDFVDPDSQISLQQIIALTWIAIHDDTLREGSLHGDDPAVIGGALGLFVDGLYEVQRGYNLSETGEDSSICPAGTFNKFVEKLWGIHPLVQLEYITRTYAASKLQIVVKEELLNYLTTETDQARSLLGSTGQDNWDEVIWEQIKTLVENRIFEEFSSLYNGNKSHPEFQALLATGVMAITNAEIERILSNPTQNSTV